PSLGEGIESGDVLEVLVNVGDVVKKDQSIVEMETDKATVSVPSPAAGKILSIAIKEGQTVPVGGVIATIEAAESAAPAKPASSPAAASAPVAPAAPAAVAPAPVKPAPVAVPAPPKVEAPRPAPVAAPVVVPPAPVQPVVAPEVVAVAAGTPFSDDVIPAGPAIRRLAREVGVDLAGIVGTGENGRITREDVMTVVRTVNQSARAGALVPVSAEVAAPAPVQQTGLGSSSASKAPKKRQKGIFQALRRKTTTVRFALIA
ncbi:MAG: E3 binding domain-containing protein, partial [Pirellula sp.]|nr:E3 binding domain-containing protein [Pirellula sp.]